MAPAFATGLLVLACTDAQPSPTGAAELPEAPRFTVAGSDLVGLGTLGGSTSAAYDINASGVVVGTSTLADRSSRAFRWTQAGGMVALPAGTHVARGINAAGQVTGRGVFGGATKAFFWTPGPGGGTLRQIPLGTPGASAGEGRDVNAAGQVAGFVTVSARPKAVLWTPDASAPGGYRTTHLGDFGGGEGEALAINAGGIVVGWAAEADGDRIPFRWTPSVPNGSTGALQRLLPGYPDFGEAHDINDAGLITGWVYASYRYPVRWDPGATEPECLAIQTNQGNFCVDGEAQGQSDDGSRLAGVGGNRAAAFAPGALRLDLAAPAGLSAAYRVSPDGSSIVGVAGNQAALWSNVVMNGPPLASVGATEFFVGVGDTLYLDATHSTDPDGDPLFYRWESAGGDTLHRGPIYAFSWPYTQRVSRRLAALDDDRAASSTFFLIYVNTPPVPVLTAPDTVRINEGSSYLFDASGSYDPDRHPILIRWNMGDGTQYEQPRLNKLYREDGSYAARLIVKDTVDDTDRRMNRADTVEVTVLVRNVRPTATFPGGGAREGEPRVVALAGAYDPSPGDADSLLYSFDCGDAVFTPFRADSTHVCPAWPNQDTVTLRGRIRDRDGGQSVYTRLQAIGNALPVVTASASATTVQVGDLVTVAAGSSFADPGADAPWTWFYDWGDGVTTRGGTATHDLPPSGHRYAAPGTYQLRISVRDDRGYGHAAPITITVSP